jgi:hypothetical protein
MNTLPDRSTSARAALVLIPTALAWMLFFYWWRRVALENTLGTATLALAILTIVALSILLSTLVWIRHNIKLASRGKRGFSTRYLRPLFECDGLDRPVVFSNAAFALEGTWFVIHADEKEKRYSHHRVLPVGLRAELPRD